jgi:hypothetical protein
LIVALSERLSRQLSLPRQIALYDSFLVRVRRQPAFSLAKELFNLILPNPIVLLCVEDRHKHVEVI